jgi:DNA-binding YbaB/EbfC family protein
MFDQFKALGALAGMLKDRDKLRGIADQFRERLEKISVTGTAGGGAIRVTVTGQLRVTDITIDQTVFSGGASGAAGKAGVQRLIQEATNDALARVQALIKQEADKQAQEMGLPNIPGIDSLLG